MARKKSGPMTQWTQYIALRVVTTLMRLTGYRFNLKLARFLGRLIFRMNRRHRDRAVTNIRRAFPEFSEDEITTTALKSFEQFMALMIELIFTPHLVTPDNWRDHVEGNGVEEARKIIDRGDPAILVTGHFASWEALGYMLSIEGFPLTALARPLDNPLVNNWLLAMRRKRGMQIIERFAGDNEKIVDVLENNGALGIVGDQNGGDKGLFVPFFDRLASTKKSVAILAINMSVPIIVGYARRLPRKQLKYEISTTDVIYPEDWKEQPDPIFYVTARYIRAIETMVRRHPELYLWMHRRWKSRPRWERQNKEIPAGQIKKLNSLPWMTEDLLEKLKIPMEPA